MPLFGKKSIKSQGCSSGEEDNVRQEHPQGFPGGRRQSAPQGPTLELPVKKERSPSLKFSFRWGGSEGDSSRPVAKQTQPQTIVESAGQSSHPNAGSVLHRSGATANPILYHNERAAENTHRLGPQGNRFSNTSDLPPSPRTSLELNPLCDAQEDNIPVFRDSGFGPDMGETDAQIKLLNDTVIVLRQTIDEQTRQLCSQISKKGEQLKRQLDGYLTKTCCDITAGETIQQKVEFHSQNDMGVGVIIFTDEPDKKGVQESGSVNDSPIYENIERSNPNRLSTGSDDSRDSYENMSDFGPQMELPTNRMEGRHNSASATNFSGMQVPAPHMNMQPSVPGYINAQIRPVPPPKPKPSFQKK